MMTFAVSAWERCYPVALGVITACVWALSGHILAGYAEAHNWHFDQIYSAFFGFASIITGFLATFYGTIQSMSSGFIQRIRGTKTLAGFLRLTKQAILMGFAGCVATVPMLIAQPIPTERFSVSSIVAALWFGIAIWAIAGFWRAASAMFTLFEGSGEGNRGAG